MRMKTRIIAMYLPQYHPTPDNDVWWGKGFTEWTNVGKAKPLFKGHYQPKIPADLGYYDLRLPIVRKQQADMAREAGIEGFCYYHYWFGNGKQELELPFNEVVKSGEPNFPFCLCWANESWHAKFWNKDGTSRRKLLIEQRYLGKEDNEKHFYALLDAFKDHRYIKYKGKLMFSIYRPLDFKNVSELLVQWNELAKKNGLEGFHFIGMTQRAEDIEEIKKLGFDAVNIFRLENWNVSTGSKYKDLSTYIMHRVFNYPYKYDYRKIMKRLVGTEEKSNDVYPTLIPNWDHTPRSGRGGFLLDNSTPELFRKHVEDVLDVVSDKVGEDRIVFLKSWNEWGEGNYVEPDMKYGHDYLNVLKEINK